MQKCIVRLIGAQDVVLCSYESSREIVVDIDFLRFMYSVHSKNKGPGATKDKNCAKVKISLSKMKW